MGFRPLNRREVAPFDVPVRKPLWNGPQIDGITYSMLTKFLQCRERFRLKVAEGLQEPHKWDHKISYGSLWHECEEAYAGGHPWEPPLKVYYEKLLAEYPANEKDITKWYMICKMQFPLYIDYHLSQRSDEGFKPLFQERAFREPYHLPDGSVLTIRGKIDSAKVRNNCVWIQENKTKGEIDIDGIRCTVDQNLQTMLYHQALRILMMTGKIPTMKIAGTIYNVIRRPLSDRFAKRQGKKETQKAFIERVGLGIAAEPHKNFFRWSVPISDRHIIRFNRECFHPILSELVRWWNGFGHDAHFTPEKNPFHYRFPFGVYHSMERGFRGDAFDYFVTGKVAGLQKVTNLFPEL